MNNLFDRFDLKEDNNKNQIAFLKSFLEYKLSKDGSKKRFQWRASQLYFSCPRAFILSEIYKDDYDFTIESNSQFMMNIGTAIHKWVQEQYYGPMQILETGEEGSWQCNHCTFKVKGKMPLENHNCINKSHKIEIGSNIHWSFNEPEFFDKELEIGGKCDGVLDLEQIYKLKENSDFKHCNEFSLIELDKFMNKYGNKVLFELKTSGSDKFNILTKPPEWYIAQANVYLRYFGYKATIIQYMNRDLSAPILKDFIIEANSCNIDSLLNRKKEYDRCKKESILPEKIDPCKKSKYCAHAKFCMFKDICFDLGENIPIDKIRKDF